jgi:SET domain-containing protein
MHEHHLNSYLSPKLEARPISKKMKGVFAREPVQKGELLTLWSGVIYSRAGYEKLPEKYQTCGIQVEENLFLSPRKLEEADYVNHSCDPNAGLSGQVSLVAMRDIAVGEQICYDYATSDGCDYDEFDCGCGAPTCRGRVTGRDWQLRELWDRYRGHFSPYLQRRIDRLKSELAAFETEEVIPAAEL